MKNLKTPVGVMWVTCTLRVLSVQGLTEEPLGDQRVLLGRRVQNGINFTENVFPHSSNFLAKVRISRDECYATRWNIRQ